MNRRKITALLVTFAIIAGSIPAQVFAVENDDSSSLEDVCKALYVYHKESEEYYKLSG